MGALTGIAAYEQNPIGIGSAALGTAYATKRYYDDVRNNRREAEQRAASYGYGYGGSYPPAYSQQVVPASYSNSYSQHINYKGFNYGASESHSASFRPPQQIRSQNPQVVYVVVIQNAQGSSSSYAPETQYPSQPPCGNAYYGRNRYAQATEEPATINSRYAEPVRYNSRPASYRPGTGTTVIGQAMSAAYNPTPAQSVIPASYSNSRSQYVSYKGASYGYSEHNSATFRPVPSPIQPTVIYYLNK